MTDPDAWVPLAEIARPHGVRGELRLKVFNQESDALFGVDEVLVRLKTGEEHEVSVVSTRRAEGGLLMKLHSVDDKNRADELRGAFVCLRRRDFPAVEAGEFYAVDIVGGEARLNGVRFGAVTDIASYPTVQVLVVRADEGGAVWEVPLTVTYVGTLDTAGRVVDLVTLEDLEPLPVKKPKPPREPRKPRRGKNRGDASAQAAPLQADVNESPAESSESPAESSKG